MKLKSNEEMRTATLKFITLYVVSILMIFIILSSFWQPVFEIKDPFSQSHSLQNVKPVSQPATEKNIEHTDSLQKIILAYENKMRLLDSNSAVQKKLITSLQKELNESIGKAKPGANNAEVARLKKQIEFFDWALRSQVAVTHTLTKENERLKATIAAMNNQQH